MCGRYTLFTPFEALAELFELGEGLRSLQGEPTGPRYNVAPTDRIGIVRREEGQRVLRFVRWGLVPHWREVPTEGPLAINARVETVRTKPTFREAFVRKRCLVPADGFYEWRREGRHKQPYFIRHPEAKPLALAGLWDRWERDDHIIESCAILTTEAASSIHEIHHRMPVALPPEAWTRWLDPGTEIERVEDLAAKPLGEFTTQAVSRRVNRTGAEGPELLTDEPTLPPPTKERAPKPTAQLSLF